MDNNDDDKDDHPQTPPKSGSDDVVLGTKVTLSTEPASKRQKVTVKEEEEDVTFIDIDDQHDDGDKNNDIMGKRDDDVLIVDPPPKLSLSSSSSNNNSTNNNSKDEEDDDIKVMTSTTTNPNIDFSHIRPLCGVHPFGSDDGDGDDNDKHNERRLLFCTKCYCVVCDIPAIECQQWKDHCHAVPKKRTPKGKSSDSNDSGLDIVDVDMEHLDEEEQEADADDPSDYDMEDFMEYLAHSRGPLTGSRTSFYGNSNSSSNRNNNDPRATGGPQGVSYGDAKKMRITEVLGQKLALQMQTVLRLSEGGRTEQGNDNRQEQQQQEQQSSERKRVPFTTRFGTEFYKMEGDIPQLGLHSSFFVEGVKIGWPFPTILPPQRQMALHIIRALKRKLHCVLESPTGTGKSAAILCSVLAWQRYHIQTSTGETENTLTDEEYDSLTTAEKQDRAAMKIILNEQGEGSKSIKSVPQIIYCSRTHSQVAQMVASLKKTPYRPKMAVLGSRERMCIHKHVLGPDNKLSINMACQYRRGNTEKERKKLLSGNSRSITYDDDNPSPQPGDGASQSRDMDGGEILEDGNSNAGGSQRRPAATCPHYRQLSTSRTAEMVVKRFVGNPKKTSCCTSGGEESSFGVHDLEDLVTFGKSPYIDHVSVYRGNDGKFGFSIRKIRDPVTQVEAGGCYIEDLVKGGTAELEGRLQEGDRILEINGKDTRQWTLDQVLEELQKTPNLKPLRMKVRHRERNNNGPVTEANRMREDDSDDSYPNQAVCPYYLSRAIQPHAEITFAPYNYILDPGIRSAMNIGLKNTVIVLDEAHNIESTLCEGGSFKYGEIDLSHIVTMLGPYARRNEKTGNIDLMGTGQKEDTSVVAHELLCFVETIISQLAMLRESFENDSPHYRKLEEEYHKYRNFPDDHEVEVCFHGPTGHGFIGKTVGCIPFFDRPGLEKFKPSYFERLLHYAVSFESEIFGGGQDSSIESQQRSNTFSKVIDLISKMKKAVENPEHFYICCNVQANGNLEHAFNSSSRQPGWKKKPQNYPFMLPRDRIAPYARLPQCNQEGCDIHHGDHCNGESPRWECHLVLKLLNPGLLLRDIAKQCRSLILASGSLSPIPSLCAELDLFGSEENTPAVQITPKKSTVTASDSHNNRQKQYKGRLQTKPPPLEANHVIDLSKQLLAVAIGTFPDGSKLTANYNNYRHDEFFPKLGQAIATVIEGVPHGGVLVFFPSYSFLRRCIKCWNPQNEFDPSKNNSCPEIWERILSNKGKIIIEPNKGQDEFEAARDDYRDTISATGSCVLLAVFRGKMSEGISFNDNNARAVICVGLPLPAVKERSVVTKQNYNDEQRKFQNKYSLLTGSEWYSQQAYRAIAQALGRCIRHQADYGTIILMDSRHCNDGSPILNGDVCRAHRNLPKWMRECVRTLSHNRNMGNNSDRYVLGGYAGLRSSMNAFFKQAPKVSDAVKKTWKEDLEKAQERSRSAAGRVFNSDTGVWASTVKSEKL